MLPQLNVDFRRLADAILAADADASRRRLGISQATAALTPEQMLERLRRAEAEDG